MATINTHTAKDGSLTYRVRARAKGQQTQTATFPSLKDARKWATMIEGQMIEGRHFPQKRQEHTLGDLLDRYAADLVPHKHPETQRSQMFMVRYWKKRLGHKLLSEISPADIVEGRDEIAKTRKPETVIKYLGVLNHALNVAMKEYDWIEHNPCSRVRKPQHPQGRLRYLSDEERSRLLQECRNSQNTSLYALVTLALATACRRGELLNLTADRVEQDKGIIYLEKTKNGSRRAIPVLGEPLALLKDLCRDKPKGAYLFPAARKGAQWRSYRRAWDCAVKRAAVENFRFHDLRHTACSYMVQAGISLYVVGQIAGHRSPVQTARYSHLQIENLRDALETLATRLSL